MEEKLKTTGLRILLGERRNCSALSVNGRIKRYEKRISGQLTNKRDRREEKVSVEWRPRSESEEIEAGKWHFVLFRSFVFVRIKSTAKTLQSRK